MACLLFGDKLSSEPMMDYILLGTWEYISVTFEPTTTMSIQENEFENVV